MGTDAVHFSVSARAHFGNAAREVSQLQAHQSSKRRSPGYPGTKARQLGVRVAAEDRGGASGRQHAPEFEGFLERALTIGA